MPTANRLGAIAAIAAAVFWGVKAITIWIAGGLDESPLESPLFVLGLVATVLAYVALGVAAARGRPLIVKVLGGAGGVLVGVGIALLADALMGAILPESTGWVEEEAGLWLAAAVTVALAVLWLRARENPRAVAPST